MHSAQGSECPSSRGQEAAHKAVRDGSEKGRKRETHHKGSGPGCTATPPPLGEGRGCRLTGPDRRILQQYIYCRASKPARASVREKEGVRGGKEEKRRKQKRKSHLPLSPHTSSHGTLGLPSSRPPPAPWPLSPPPQDGPRGPPAREHVSPSEPPPRNPPP